LGCANLWAINCVTGYLGHQDIVLGSNALSSGYLDTLVPVIQMYPPNLKIWAERSYDIDAGLTKNETRHYLIGNEGVGEADDTYIKINVDWRDQDGSALPEALSQYGYTGRLAYVSGTNELTDASQVGHARFGIEPGIHTEMIRLKSSNANQHYYVQVNAVPYADFDDFALSEDETQNRSSEATFDELARNHYRPERFVPIRTAQYNEQLTEIQSQAYLIEKRKREEQGISLDGLAKPSALYDWYYRPDYQFSVYDLTLDAINLIGTDPDTGEETATDIKPSNDPKITGASVVDILYGLTGSDQAVLDRFDGEQTLTLALGQQETEITLTDNNTIRFESLDYLNQLGSDDYLSIAIYTNEDAGNLLYEYMFGRNGLHVYYNIPAIAGNPGNPDNLIELHRINQPGDQPDWLRTLGGMRLKYAYQPPMTTDDNGQSIPTELDQFFIRITGSDGWLCKHHVGYLNEFEQDADCIKTVSGTEIELEEARKITHSFNNEAAAESWAFWWEPTSDHGASGSNATLTSSSRWENDLQITVTTRATFPEIDDAVERRLLITRELGPVEEDEELLSGDDVAILESTLWHLGFSPQYPSEIGVIETNAGALGARIASNRAGQTNGTINTTGCAGQAATDRSVFLPGPANSTEACALGAVSTELLLKRFKAMNRAGDSFFVFEHSFKTAAQQ
jgi:hypothetical protein